jgi:septal ring factor EnvC (AmiA/AmiB activator)
MPWAWPLDGHRLVARYVAPAHAYGAGHRGIDLAPTGSAVVRAPADGVIAFAGAVAGRGVVTIDAGAGVVVTLEPVQTETVAGVTVHRGDAVGTLSVGGHAAPGTLHLGVRVDGEYVNPLTMYGVAARAILLPCCG